MWVLYELLLIVGLLFYIPKALWRRRLPHRGWSMRLGRYPADVRAALAGKRVLWVHAVSVGEMLAARPLLRQLCAAYPDDRILLSTVTPGGFSVASEQVNGVGAAIYFPLDLRGCVARALDAFRPRALLLIESELWPTVIRLAKARGIPVAVVNGRISARAYRRYLWVKPWLTGMLQQVDLFLMQSQADADRIVLMGAPLERVHVAGSLKWDASLGARPASEAVRQAAAHLGLSGQETVMVAGSTHRGEESAVLQAFQAVRQMKSAARLVIAPRHLERLGELEGLVRHHGLTCQRASQAVQGSWDVAIVDTYGQLPSYYGLATIAFIGGSLIPHGGQNPLEAASVGKPIVFGPWMQNFETIAHELLAHHAARRVETPQEFVGVVQELLEQPAEAQAMGQRAQKLTEQFQGATHRTIAALQSILP